MKSLVVLLTICFVFVFATFVEARPYRWGTRLQVSIDLQHRDIAKSKKAPEEVLVDRAHQQNYFLKVIKTERKDNVQLVKVAIPRSANKEMYIEFLKTLGFVKSVIEVPKGS